jgi:hypothetical protein
MQAMKAPRSLAELRECWRQRLDEARRHYERHKTQEARERYAQTFQVFTNLVVNGVIPPEE